MPRPIEFPESITQDFSNYQVRIVKTIEDRIEQKYKAEDILFSLNTINKIARVDPPALSERQKEILDEMAHILSKSGTLLGKREKSQIEVDRDTIHEIVQRYGVATVLSFVDTQLITNIEKFFSGLVVSYIGMFESNGKRSSLGADKVFKGHDDIGILHSRFYNLRNTWYAHNGRDDGRHVLRYKISADGNIEIDKNGVQITPEYHLSEYQNLYRCVMCVLDFLETDINKKSLSFKGSLTEDQKDTLQRHWENKIIAKEG